MSDVPPVTRVYRLPPLTYVPLLFFWVGAIPVAFASDGGAKSAATLGIGVLVLVLPLIATVFVVRTATVVNPAGVLVRAAFGKRLMRWDDIRGLSVTDRAVYAVLRDGAVRLPCVRVSMLADLARASGGRLPEIADPVVKTPPARTRRRR